MPKCPSYNTPYCKSDGQPCTHVVDCHNGYLKFWTEAERAGMKALGGEVKDAWNRAEEETAIRATIAYVSAAIKSKQGGRA
jgi:hypothetical protein